MLGRKVMTNLDSILESRDITLPTKVHLVKAMVFPVVMYGCESWTVKKAEGWKIDAFELWCWRRLLSIPWTARRSNQSILKEISPGCSLGLMLKLKLQYFGHLMRRADSFEKTLMLGGIGGRRRRGLQRMRWPDGITDSMEMGLVGSCVLLTPHCVSFELFIIFWDQTHYFSCLVLELTTSPRNPTSIYWCIFRNQDIGAGHAFGAYFEFKNHFIY